MIGGGLGVSDCCALLSVVMRVGMGGLRELGRRRQDPRNEEKRREREGKKESEPAAKERATEIRSDGKAIRWGERVCAGG